MKNHTHFPLFASNAKVLSAAILLVVLPVFLSADDWNTGPGGKPSRHSLSSEQGPATPTLLWQGGLNAVIAQQAVIDGNVVAMSRIFNISNVLHGTLIVAHDLATGDTLWTKDLPVDFPSTDWRNRVSAIRDGVVYATRAGNTNYSYMYALDALTGVLLWKSEGLVNESSTEGASFAADGDLIVGNFDNVIRINAADGTTQWTEARSCPTSNGQEVAVFGDRGYYWEASPYGPKVSAVDLETGDFLYSSAALSAGLVQQVGLFIGPGGTIYAPRSMNNASTDFLFALHDDGGALSVMWSTPLGYVPFATFGVGPDGSVYSYSTAGEVIRLDPLTGNILNTSQVIYTTMPPQPRMAIDANGYVFVTNGEFATGTFYSFNPDLTLRWSESILNVNVGGPAIGQNGTLIICGVGTNVRAYQGSYSLNAGFTATPTDPCEGETVQFTDQSSGNIVSWNWTFPGGNPSTSNLQNPVVTYPVAGSYDVTLLVSDGTNSDVLTKEDYIQAIPLPVVTFDPLPDFCLTDPQYYLTEGHPDGGIYAGPGVAGGYFFPATAGTGLHTLTYTYTGANGCSNEAQQTVLVEDCTGLQERDGSIISIRTYPNPVKDILHIEFEANEEGGCLLEIIDAHGGLRGAYRFTSVTGKNTCTLSTDLPEPGLYLLRLTMTSGRTAALKVVVAK
jgi:PKD repeat protein